MEPILGLALAAGSGALIWIGRKNDKTWMSVIGALGLVMCLIAIVSVIFVLMAFSSEVNR